MLQIPVELDNSLDIPKSIEELREHSDILPWNQEYKN